MEKHPSYDTLKGFLQKYPKCRGAIYQVYNDIVYAQQWTDIQTFDAPRAGRAIISGIKPNQEHRSFVAPCGLDEKLSIYWTSEVFEEIPHSDGLEVYLGITSEDSSIVYYKITPGIVKPKN